jgi:hypothetical protein
LGLLLQQSELQKQSLADLYLPLLWWLQWAARLLLLAVQRGRRCCCLPVAVRLRLAAPAAAVAAVAAAVLLLLLFLAPAGRVALLPAPPGQARALQQEYRGAKEVVTCKQGPAMRSSMLGASAQLAKAASREPPPGELLPPQSVPPTPNSNPTCVQLELVAPDVRKAHGG